MLSRNVTQSTANDVSRARLAAIVRSSVDAIVGLTLEGSIADWNPAAERLFGFTAAEVIGRDLAVVIPLDRMAEAEAILDRVRRGESVAGVETVRRTKDGRTIEVSLTISPVWDDTGTIIATSAIIRDITAAKAREARYRAVVDQVPAIIYSELRETEPVVTYMSPYVETVLGIPAAAFVADHGLWLEHVHPDDRDRVRAAKDQMQRSGTPFAADYRMVAADGRTVWIHDVATLVHDDAGRPLCWQGVALDVTTHKELERELLASEARFRTLVEQLPGAIYLLADDEQQTPLYFSPYIEAVTGETPEEAMASHEHWLDLVHPEDRERVAAVDERAGERAESFRVEYRHRHKDGRYVWVRDECVPVDDGTGRIVAWQGVMLDITERTETEQALAASETRFRTAFADAPIGMALVHPDGRMFQVNRALCAMLGYAESELRTMRFQEVTHPDDLAHDLAQLRRTLAGEISTYELEKRYIRHDGQIIWVRLSTSLFRDENGAPLHFISQIEDVTQRRDAEAELAVTHQHTREVLERITDNFYALDREWRFTYLNEAAAQIFGRPRETLLGQTFWEAFPRVIESPLHQAFHQALADGCPTTIEFLYTPLNRWFEVRVYPSANGLSVFFRDVTDRIQAEEARAWLVAIVESAEDAIVSRTLDGTITSWNGGAERLYGYRAEEMIGRSLSRLMPDGDAANIVVSTEALGERPTQFEAQRQRRDGTLIDVAISLFPIRDPHGGVIGVSSITRDITARNQADAELRAALDSAHAANRATRQFQTMMSHELRTPMQAIMGYAELLLAGPEGSLTPEQTEDVQTIHRGATRLVALVKQLLDLSRLEAGQTALKTESVALAAVIEKVRQDVAPQAAAKALTLRIDLPDDLSPVLGDELGVYQILLNLVGNAVKFTERGEVRISAETVDGEVAVAVRDTGIGIAADDLPSIFEEFRQAEGGMIRRYEGAGLGLAIARKLAERMGGRLTVASQPGVGSIFTLHLPADGPVHD